MPGKLWRHHDFLKLWAGQSVSLVGTEVTLLALPTVAILNLHANAIQVGLLAAAQQLPFPLFSIFAGVWVDRLRRRPLMIAADVARGLALASIPVATLWAHLSLAQLYAVAFIVGTFTVLFDISYLAFLPALVGGSDLVEGNTKLQLSGSVARLSGPGIGGLLIQFFGAAKAITADAFSYAVSVLCLLLIATRERANQPSTEPSERNMLLEIREGFALVFRSELLRGMLATNTIAGLGFHMAVPIVFIYAYRSLHLSPGLVGLVFVVEGIGSLLAALSSTQLVRALRLGRTLLITQLVCGVLFTLVPLASLLPAVPTLIAVFLLMGYFETVFDINQVSVRQSVTPHRLQGRMNASFRTIFWGVRPIAGPLGGVVASLLSPAAALILGGGLAIVSCAAIIFSPVIHLREHATGVLEVSS